MSNLKGVISRFGGEPKKESLNVKDTDFILKLIMDSSFSGLQLEQAYIVLKKITNIHKGFLNET